MPKRATNRPHVVNVSVRMSADLAEWLRAEAETRMVSTAYLVNCAVSRLRDELPTVGVGQ